MVCAPTPRCRAQARHRRPARGPLTTSSPAHRLDPSRAPGFPRIEGWRCGWKSSVAIECEPMRCVACNRSAGESFCAACGAEARTFPGYQLVSLLGQGAAAQVFRARQIALERDVCLKRLLPAIASDATNVTRFRREALALASVKHPNVVSVHDVRVGLDGMPFIVMDFVAGASLRSVLKREAPFEPLRAVGFVDQVLAALEATHAAGLVHRDLKPTNVMVSTLADGREWCSLLDFGIVKTLASDEPLTKGGFVLGTPGYMAPEQILDDEVDGRSDLFAVGVILFELLTGTRPFQARSDVERMRRTVVDETPVAATRSASVPPVLDVVCRRAMARVVEERFESATAFRAALVAVRQSLSHPAAGGQPPAVEAPAASPGQGVAALGLEHQPLTSLVDQARRAPTALAQWAAIEQLERRFRSALGAGALDELVPLMLVDLDVPLPFPEVERTVAERLSKVAAGSAPAVLALASREDGVAMTAWLLGRLGASGAAALAGGLTEVPPRHRGSLMARLWRFDEVEAVVAALSRAGPDAARSAVECSEGLHDVLKVSLVSGLLRSLLEPIRLAALEGLSDSLAFRVSARVRPLLRDESKRVRAAAMRWVFRIEDEGAVPELGRLVRLSADPEERLASARVLARLGEGGLSTLVERLSNETNHEVARVIAELLVASGWDAGFERVAALANDERTPAAQRRIFETALSQAPGDAAEMAPQATRSSL
ncbi:MAG: protein kinase [Myxococcaceae bacterium]|nr:protein kinase [Myxococcaceae bacterium]